MYLAQLLYLALNHNRKFVFDRCYQKSKSCFGKVDCNFNLRSFLIVTFWHFAQSKTIIFFVYDICSPPFFHNLFVSTFFFLWNIINWRAKIKKNRLKYDFRPCKKKVWKTSLQKFLFEKGSWLQKNAEVAWLWPCGSCWLCNYCHVACHIILHFKKTILKFRKLFF